MMATPRIMGMHAKWPLLSTNLTGLLSTYMYLFSDCRLPGSGTIVSADRNRPMTGSSTPGGFALPSCAVEVKCRAAVPALVGEAIGCHLPAGVVARAAVGVIPPGGFALPQLRQPRTSVVGSDGGRRQIPYRWQSESYLPGTQLHVDPILRSV